MIERWGMEKNRVEGSQVGAQKPEAYAEANSVPRPPIPPNCHPAIGSTRLGLQRLKMRKGSLSGSDLLEGPPDAILVSVVHTADPDLSKD